MPLPLLFGHPARVRAYFGYRSAERLVLPARALRMTEPSWEWTGTVGKVRAIVSQFASKELPGIAVKLELASKGRDLLTVTEVSDGDGFVHFDIPLPSRWELPEETVWEIARLHWRNRKGEQSVNAYILAPGRRSELAVISDIDDTIIETGADSLARNWRRVVAQMPGERDVVPGAVEFFGHLGGGSLGEAVPASRRPFFYVSSSPWNLFEYVVDFQKKRGLPQGPLLLRNWGLNLATLGRGSHGSHKANAIRGLTEFYPDLRFALIGDDTQADALAFATAVAAHPGRIAAVFIRRAPGAGVGPAEQAALEAIVAAGVPLWSGESWDVGAEFLAAAGFTPGGETAEIVRTIDQAKQLAKGAGPASAPVQTGNG